MKRRRRALMPLAALLLAGCATIMPNTATAIAPATFDEVALAVAADIEQWVQFALNLFGF